MNKIKSQPKEWYITANTVRFENVIPYNGKYKNDIETMPCDCPCHLKHTDILHYESCCDSPYKKEN